MLERRVVGALVRTAFLRSRRAGPWPTDLDHAELTIKGNAGARLAARLFRHPRPRGLVVLAHPDRRYGQHWFVREGWVAWLLENGFESLTFDFPDYGASRGGSTFYHDDVLAAARAGLREAGGLPVHVLGISMGAFAAANASPSLDFVDGLVLESPYPSFAAWYGPGGKAIAQRAFERAFPRSAAQIQADRNLARCAAKRVLVVAGGADSITPARLSRAVAEAQPRARYLELPGLDHFEAFPKSEAYRRAVLETFGALGSGLG
ncbi:MAG: hypothetical protein QOE90_2886, partial [Thermoplasmata archaeon]|nr:hypothetical protein [Thermoplasmata archaeon]